MAHAEYEQFSFNLLPNGVPNDLFYSNIPNIMCLHNQLRLFPQLWVSSLPLSFVAHCLMPYSHSRQMFSHVTITTPACTNKKTFSCQFLRKNGVPVVLPGAVNIAGIPILKRKQQDAVSWPMLTLRKWRDWAFDGCVNEDCERCIVHFNVGGCTSEWYCTELPWELWKTVVPNEMRAICPVTNEWTLHAKAAVILMVFGE